MTSLLTPDDIKIFIFNTIQQIVGINNERLTTSQLAKLVNKTELTIKKYRNKGMPHTVYKGVTYYRLKKVIKWMKAQGIKVSL